MNFFGKKQTLDEWFESVKNAPYVKINEKDPQRDFKEFVVELIRIIRAFNKEDDYQMKYGMILKASVVYEEIKSLYAKEIDPKIKQKYVRIIGELDRMLQNVITEMRLWATYEQARKHRREMRLAFPSIDEGSFGAEERAATQARFKRMRVRS